MDVIGHRGAAALAPENTIAALRAGIDAGADGVEVDVRLSADGVAFLMHDPDVARTMSGSGRVADLDADALTTLGVTTLDDALATVPLDRLIVVEVKGTPWDPGHDPSEPAARLVGARLAAEPDRRAVVSSFNPFALAVVRAVAPGVPTGVLTSPAFDLDSNLSAAIEGGNEECHVPAEILEEAFVARVHAAGRRVVAWTVNDPADIAKLDGWGVDGLITDDPRMALATLGRSRD
ncbi:MAG TPA: glycerophosphodiester phosphodiesterase [Actinomycetota bacterium]|nr:glycerophosphodiester phosphodiesterase [Actinomycetota bacterium]